MIYSFILYENIYMPYKFGNMEDIMSYTFEKLEKSQVKFQFDIDSTTFADAIKEAYQKTKHKFQIQGFRKGHVPMNVIVGIYGKEVFYEDAMDIVIPRAYGEALSKENLDVVSQPELTAFDFKEDGGATFELIVTVKPEVALGQYKGLEIAKKVDRITAKQVDEAVEQNRQKQARLVDTDKAAEMGDIVDIDFVGSVDGVKFEGGAAEHYELELGSGQFIPGFEEQLVGVKAGDNKAVNVKFPEEYHAENLKGQDAVFECTVHAVKVKELPALDDDFAKDVSEFDTLAEYKNDIKNKMKEDAELRAERAYEDALVEAIVKNATVEIPEVMIDNEAEDMVAEFEYRLMYQGIKLDDYLSYVGMDKDALKKEYKAQAENSVKVRLVMEQIVRTEDLKFSDEEIDEKLSKMAADAGKDLDTYRKSLRKEQIDYIVNQILSDKLMALLKKENSAVSKASAKKAAEETTEAAPAPKKAPAKKTTKKAEQPEA